MQSRIQSLAKTGVYLQNNDQEPESAGAGAERSRGECGLLQWVRPAMGEQACRQAGRQAGRQAWGVIQERTGGWILGLRRVKLAQGNSQDRRFLEYTILIE